MFPTHDSRAGVAWGLECWKTHFILESKETPEHQPCVLVRLLFLWVCVLVIWPNQGTSVLKLCFSKPQTTHNLTGIYLKKMLFPHKEFENGKRARYWNELCSSVTNYSKQFSNTGQKQSLAVQYNLMTASTVGWYPDKQHLVKYDWDL